MRRRALLLGLLALPLAAAAAAPERAHTLAVALPEPVAEAAAVWTGQHVFLFGGRNASGPTDAIVRIDPATHEVRRMEARLPVPLAGLAAGYEDGIVYLVGGRGPDGDPSPVYHRYHVAEDRTDTPWQGSLGGRAEGAALWTGRRVVYFGGVDAAEVPTSRVVEIDPLLDTTSFLGDLPGPRRFAGAAANATHAFVLGGEDASGVLDSVVRLDPRTGRSTLLEARLPEPRARFAAAREGETIVILGGVDAAGRALDGILRFDPRAGTIERAGTLPAPRHGAAIVDIGRDLLLLGGADAQGAPVDRIFSWRPPAAPVSLAGAVLPERRNEAGAAWDGASVHVFGGRRDEALGDVVRYTPATDRAETRGAKLPQPRWGAAVVWDGSSYLVVGGEARETLLGARTPLLFGDVLRYDPRVDAIGPTQARLPEGRSGAAAAWIEGALWVAGGRSAAGGSADVLRLDPDGGETLRVSTLPAPVWGAGAFALGGDLYLLGGETPEGPSDRILRVSTGTGLVETLPTRLPAPILRPQVASDGTYAYVLHADGIDRFTPGDASLARLPSRLPEPVAGAAAVWAQDEIVLLGGSGASGVPRAEILRYAPRTETLPHAPGLAPPLPWAPIALATLGALGAIGLVVAARRAGPGFARAWSRRRGPPARYVEERALGAGAMGAAILARDELLGRRVVLKKLHSSALGATARAALLREARAAALVTHRSLVTIYDVATVGDDDVIVMEHLPGGSLADRLAQGPLPEPLAVGIVRELLGGLAALHAAGVLHRDVKPANVLFAEDGSAKLTDFGIARAPGSPHLSAPGLQPGTVVYMSPEQARGDEIDPRSDLYSLAALLYESVAAGHYLGELPPSDFAAREAVVQRAPRLPLGSVSPGLNAVLAKALAKDPRARFQTAEDMRAALGRLGAAGSGTVAA